VQRRSHVADPLDRVAFIAYDVETEVKVRNRQIVMNAGPRAHRERDARMISERQANRATFGRRAGAEDERQLYCNRAIALVASSPTSTAAGPSAVARSTRSAT